MPPSGLLLAACRPALRPALRALARPAARGRAAATTAVDAAPPPQQPPPQAMDAALRATVEAVHASPTQAVIYLSGGGAQGLGWLLSVPGASGTILEAMVPYARESMLDLLGHEPEKYASPETAQALALAAYRRALRLAPPGADVAGVALTGALATGTPKRGAHGCHVATRTARGTALFSLALAKGARDRPSEDALTGRLLIRALAEACGLGGAPDGVFAPALAAAGLGERLDAAVVPFADPLGALLAGDAAVGALQLAGGLAVGAVGASGARVLLPGSFNPLHSGHVALLAAARAACGGAPGGYELSVRNADKGALPRADVERRAAQFSAADPPLVLTDAPLFVQKAALLPGTTFVVGVDTALRIVMPKYYAGGDEAAMRAVLQAILDAKCSFLVAGRLMDGVFVEPTAVVAPPGMEGLFRSLTSFRADISSTELRTKAAAEAAAAAAAAAAAKGAQ